MPDQPALSADVLKDPDMVNAFLLDRVRHRQVFQNAFREQDVSSVGDDEVSFYVDNGKYDTEEIEIVEEGSEFPERQGDRRKVRAQRYKYGEEYNITMEAARDDAAGEVAIEAERKINRLANTMDAAAFRQVEAGVAGNDHSAITPSGSNGELTYEDFVDADTQVRDSEEGEYAPSALFVGFQGLGDVRKMDEFTHATAEGDETIRFGRVGSIAGLGNVYITGSPLIDMGSGEAYVVDGEWFGRRAEWLPPTTRAAGPEQGSNFDKQIDTKMQMYTLIGYTETHPNAATRIGN
jgi:hypothetical protein